MDNALDLIKQTNTQKISTYFLLVQDRAGVPELTSSEDIKPTPELAKWHMLRKAYGTTTWTIKQEATSTYLMNCNVVKNNICRQPQHTTGKRQLLAETNVKVTD